VGWWKVGHPLPLRSSRARDIALASEAAGSLSESRLQAVFAFTRPYAFGLVQPASHAQKKSRLKPGLQRVAAGLEGCRYRHVVHERENSVQPGPRADARWSRLNKIKIRLCPETWEIDSRPFFRLPRLAAGGRPARGAPAAARRTKTARAAILHVFKPMLLLVGQDFR
jgi:hypothetical protein